MKKDVKLRKVYKKFLEEIEEELQWQQIQCKDKQEIHFY